MYKFFIPNDLWSEYSINGLKGENNLMKINEGQLTSVFISRGTQNEMTAK